MILLCEYVTMPTQWVFNLDFVLELNVADCQVLMKFEDDASMFPFYLCDCRYLGTRYTYVLLIICYSFLSKFFSFLSQISKVRFYCCWWQLAVDGIVDLLLFLWWRTYLIPECFGMIFWRNNSWSVDNGFHPPLESWNSWSSPLVII